MNKFIIILLIFFSFTLKAQTTYISTNEKLYYWIENEYILFGDKTANSVFEFSREFSLLKIDQKSGSKLLFLSSLNEFDESSAMFTYLDSDFNKIEIIIDFEHNAIKFLFLDDGVLYYYPINKVILNNK